MTSKKSKAKPAVRTKAAPEKKTRKRVAAPNAIQVKKGVPVPTKPSFRGHVRSLKVGESFSVSIEYWQSLRNAAAAVGKAISDRKYSVHKLPDDPTQVGVWRTK